jgi:hypothetical protein
MIFLPGRKDLYLIASFERKESFPLTITFFYSEIDIGRHPGQTLGPQRPPTAEELKLCQEVVDAIITGYAKHVHQKGTK